MNASNTINASEFGAIQTDNNEYVLPYKAEKNKNYKCIGCQQKLILKKGNIRKCHFAHDSNTNCSYFEHPNESDLHKEAKYKLASWLKQQKTFGIVWSCCKINNRGNKCGNSNNEMRCTIKYEENDKVEIEYHDVNNKYIADIAVINNNKVKYIFEIKNTHSTITDVRPEPWFEIDALKIIQHKDTEDAALTCMRYNKNRYCSNCKILDEECVNNLPRLYNNGPIYLMPEVSVQQTLIDEYLRSLDEMELIAYNIAKSHLGTLFSVEKSNHYLDWFKAKRHLE